MVKWPILLAVAAGVNAVILPRSFLPAGVPPEDRKRQTNYELYDQTLDALQVMQGSYFETWVGTWPRAIDWTAAVLGTHVAGALQSIATGLDRVQIARTNQFNTKENMISLYYSQLIGFYFGQDAFSLRNQAFDDMLWVVLGWLDTIRFANVYNRNHFKSENGFRRPSASPPEGWHGKIWLPAFSHRARIFWHLASAGWDTKLCGGGMNWNPRLTPYKNAITNQLFIAASVNMYLFFPGDENTSPFALGRNPQLPDSPGAADWGWGPRDPKYLEAAIDAYEWLASSRMTNSQGLFADGFHISGYPSSNNTKCDERDEMVYTYNQGVILTGQRGLYHATGKVQYIREGHRLIQNVIAATGWHLGKDAPIDELSDRNTAEFPRWHGLGRAGILEEACDISGSCSQDAQTFKGIWTHHFTTFCAPLDPPLGDLKLASRWQWDNRDHLDACRKYYNWLNHNVQAALATRDADGKFGMWWTVGLFQNLSVSSVVITPDILPNLSNATDYRNDGVPNDPRWVGPNGPPGDIPSTRPKQPGFGPGQKVTTMGDMHRRQEVSDPNDRGRGRTVETQSGGVALLRALWEISRLPGRFAISGPPNRAEPVKGG